MEVYLNRLDVLIEDGYDKNSRTGTDTKALFGRVVRYDLTDYKIPVLTTKKIFLRSLIHETIWFISGSTQLAYLKKHGIGIWDSWVKPGTEVYDTEGKLVDGSIGLGAYGYMWRGIEDTRLIKSGANKEYEDKGFETVFKGEYEDVVTRKIDQLGNVIDLLRNDPDSRRIIIDSFEQRFVDFAALIACHCYVQFFSRKLTLSERIKHYEKFSDRYEGEILERSDYPLDCGEEAIEKLSRGCDRMGVPKRALSVMLVMRSNDASVGEPFNMAQYALLAHKVAHVTGHLAEELVYVNGDHHIYVDQIELAKEQIAREPIKQTTTVELNPSVKEIDDFTFEDVTIHGYDNYHPSIKYPVAV